MARSANAFVPAGSSYWELSNRKDIKQKADEDYETRVKHLDGVYAKNSTYVCVTSRRWQGKEMWAAARETEGVWHSVRAYDADDIETWLESAPAVHIWLSILLGKHPEGIIDIEAFWTDWSHATQPALSSPFVLSGRETTVEKLHLWLRGSSESVAIKAESQDEAVAVVAAAILALPPEERLVVLSRAAVVTSASGLTQIASFAEPLILISMVNDEMSLSRAVRAGHRIVVPLGADSGESATTLVITRLS